MLVSEPYFPDFAQSWVFLLRVGQLLNFGNCGFQYINRLKLNLHIPMSRTYDTTGFSGNNMSIIPAVDKMWSAVPTLSEDLYCTHPNTTGDYLNVTLN